MDETAENHALYVYYSTITFPLCLKDVGDKQNHTFYIPGAVSLADISFIKKIDIKNLDC